MILTHDYMQESFCNKLYSAVREWELQHGIICDFDVVVHGFKIRDYALRTEIRKEMQKEA